MDIEQLSDVIGQNVRRHRVALGWSQDALAEASDLSKGTVVAIEQQRANPSVATLCALSEALNVGLSTLLEAPASPHVKLRPADAAIELWRTDGGSHARLLLGTDPPNAIELWHWEVQPGDAFDGGAHPRGTIETLHVLDGALTVTVGDRTVRAASGDSLAFEATVPHRYACEGEAAVRFSMWITVGETGQLPPLGDVHEATTPGADA